MGQGVVYEAFNLASLFQLPILFILEDNGIAQTTKQDNDFVELIPHRILGMGIEYRRSDTEEPEYLLKQAQISTDLIRNYCEPYFLHIETNRLHAHSKGGETRSEEEMKKLWESDYLSKCQTTDI
jgi:TPP-dependent pyruvate/acetoin dehydrogenase alpha subunit